MALYFPPSLPFSLLFLQLQAKQSYSLGHGETTAKVAAGGQLWLGLRQWHVIIVIWMWQHREKLQENTKNNNQKAFSRQLLRCSTNRRGSAPKASAGGALCCYDFMCEGVGMYVCVSACAYALARTSCNVNANFNYKQRQQNIPLTIKQRQEEYT